jgi:formate C-acetyltransferase
VEARRAQLERDGIVTIWPDYDHSVPIWGRVLSLGFSGLLEQSEAARRSRALSEDQEAFFEGIRITYSAIIDFICRLASLAEATEGSEQMARALKNIAAGAPSTFYEAMLVDYLYFMLCEHIEGLQVRSLGNFDRLFYPFFRADLERGVSEEELRRQLAYFFMQFTAIGNYWGQPVFLGGDEADGSTVINPLSYIFLDVYDKLCIFNPKIQIKVSDSTPKELVCRALDMIRRGNNSIVFVSDNTVRRSLVRAGATEEQARTCNIQGCYEYSLDGEFGCGMNYLNLLKPLEYALHEGHDGVTGVFAGLVAPPLDEYDCFEKLLAEYKRQLARVIDITVETVNGFEEYLHVINPLSMISATIPACLESGRDAIGGGALENACTLEFGFIADLADSLMMIKKYVFERGEVTLPALVAMLDCDFAGNERFAARLRADREKYGNNMDRPDAMVTDIVDFAVSQTVGRPSCALRGGKWNCGFHVARQSYTQADKTAASANGRRFGEELSKNVSASMGRSREGVTAAIMSATKIDATSFTRDAALDVGMLPSTVKGEVGLEAMYSLLRTFIERGGHAMHINVFDASTLRAAQERPELYEDLQIRICGWNALWNTIERKEQDGFIRQAESLR